MANCLQCGETLIRRKGEARTVFARRKFCCVRCGRQYFGARRRDRSTPLQAVERIGWSVVNGCWEWNGARSGGYGVYGTQVTSAGERLAHRLAYIAWNGPISPDQVVRHRCDNPPCINPDHLELGTHADNMNDAKVRGRTARGEAHGRSRLTESDVLDIRAAAGSGESHRSIGARYGLNKYTVGKIFRRERWGRR